MERTDSKSVPKIMLSIDMDNSSFNFVDSPAAHLCSNSAPSMELVLVPANEIEKEFWRVVDCFFIILFIYRI